MDMFTKKEKKREMLVWSLDMIIIIIIIIIIKDKRKWER